MSDRAKIGHDPHELAERLRRLRTRFGEFRGRL